MARKSLKEQLEDDVLGVFANTNDQDNGFSETATYSDSTGNEREIEVIVDYESLDFVEDEEGNVGDVQREKCRVFCSRDEDLGISEPEIEASLILRDEIDRPWHWSGQIAEQDQWSWCLWFWRHVDVTRSVRR